MTPEIDPATRALRTLLDGFLAIFLELLELLEQNFDFAVVLLQQLDCIFLLARFGHAIYPSLSLTCRKREQ